MSYSANLSNDVPVRALSFRQWQVWAVLSLAAMSGFLSLSVHFAYKDLAAVEGLVGAMAALDLDAQEVPSNPQSWIVDAQQLLPSLALYAEDSVAQVREPLSDLTRRIGAGSSAPLIDQIHVRQRLSWIEAELRSVGIVLDLRTSQATHFYYLSVIAFVVAMAGFFGWRWKLRVHSPLQQYLTDEIIFSSIPVPISVSDSQDRLLRANAAFEDLTGFTTAEMSGQRTVSRDSDEEQMMAERMQDELKARGSWTGDYNMRCKDGSAHAEKVMRVSLNEPGQPAEGYLTMSLVANHTDAEQRLMLWQAHHDNLTKLPNANLLKERLARAMQEGKRGAVITIDLDNFKKTNDYLGHAGADRVLTEAAHRIAMTSREGDTVARMGGDLFVIAMTEIEDVGEVERVARMAVESISPAFMVPQGELFITASAGVAIFPDDGETPGELLQKADSARTDAKTKGGGQMLFFEAQMNAEAARRFELESHLRRALAGQEFELHFQPLIDISQDSVYGAEALLRWNNPVLGMVSPMEFIPVAESTGLIVDIGRWVVAEVQRHLGLWQDSIPGLRISLNVSARQLDSTALAEDLLEVLGREFADQITVELTESILVQEDSAALLFLQGLHELKAHVALDDFGTGYSSVGYLRDYEFDVLKVDKSFIDGIDGVRDLGLVASIVAMGRILGMRVVAEGVEEEAQVQRLKRIGCDYIQGYYYSKPLPASSFEEFVLAHRAERST